MAESDDPESETPEPTDQGDAGQGVLLVANRNPLSRWIVGGLLGLVLLVVAAIGWQTWSRSSSQQSAQEKAEAEAKEKDEAAKQKEVDPKVERMVIQPGEPKSDVQAVKPGHWVTGTERMRAMYQDFVGTLDTTVVNGRGEPYPVDATPYVLESTRPVALSKGQPKEIETTFLVPQVARAIQVRNEIAERGFGRSMRAQLPVTRMPSYQYYFVVLAEEPNRYAFVKALDSVTVPWDGETEVDDTEDPLHYRVVSLPVKQEIPLSDNPLTWTGIAYMLWDEVDPKLFTPEQARAMVDWLHWGGQLVVNGPGSLDLLKGSFLEPYLPATSGGSRQIVAADLSELNRNWTIKSPGANRPLAPASPWSGVELVSQLAKGEVDELGERTGGLLMERAVGRGRIVVSAMQLGERDLVNWQSGFSSLFNGGILRRPHREYRKGYYDELTLAWADPTLKDHRLDADLTTGLRYLARDWGVDSNYKYVDVPGEGVAGAWQTPEQMTTRELKPPDEAGGIGAWNDFSSTAKVARESLVEAAGVEVPDTSFVVLCLAIYLVVLVPLNWLVFSALGRVEWAWIAAPIIAIAGTWAIVDRARLDIGFVRAQTEIGVLELQPNYDRGHLSRYTALYTSLSTTYDMEFENPTAVAAPFPTDTQVRGPVSSSTCEYERYDAPRLKGVFVPSNTTNMVHSEQMFVLDGAIRLGRSVSQNQLQIENRSQHLLSSVALVERTSREEEAEGEKPRLRGMWIGELRPGESKPAFFDQSIVVEKGEAAFQAERATEEKLRDASGVDLEPMFRLALNVKNFEPGEKRLVGRIDEVLAGQKIEPAASQVKGGVLVVAHLEYGPRAEPKPDLNTSRDVVVQAADEEFEFE